MPLDIVGTQGSPALPVTQYPQGQIIQSDRGLYGADGTIILPQIVIEEKHTDDLEITDHPIEIGAAITDHAFKHPAELNIQIGFSNSPIVLSSDDKYSDPFDVKVQYKELLRLQEQRVLLTVQTGKRSYDNMLIKSMVTTTDNKTESSLFVMLSLKQVILVNTRTVMLKKEVQASPKQTTGVTNLGTVKTSRAPRSSVQLGAN